MPFISKECVEKIKNASNIVRVVSDYIKIEEKGSQYWGSCPFHTDKTPSFSVTPDKNLFHCFSCHAGGDSVKFIMEMEKISYPEALSLLAKKFGIPLEYSDSGYTPEKKDTLKEDIIELYGRTASMFHYLLTQTEGGKVALKYILDRGLTMETIEKFKLGYAPQDRKWLKKFLKSKNYSDEFLSQTGLFSKKYPDIAFFSDRLMFPFFDKNGQAIAFGGRILHPQGPDDRKYLNSGDLIQYKKGENLYAFNFAKDAMRQKKFAIICEGYMDCIAYHQCGITNAVASLGTALTEDQVRLLQRFTGNGEVYLSFDSDGAGQKATFKSILMCRKMGLAVKIVKLMGGKDPAEIMVNYGAETLTKDVNNAILDSDFLLNSLSTQYGETPDGIKNACLQYFTYVDVLSSETQKYSTLEKLSALYHIPMESVLSDYKNRNASKQNSVSDNQADMRKVQKAQKIEINSELRFLLAVVTEPKTFESVRSQIGVEDFESSEAKDLYLTLEEFFRKDELSTPEVVGYYAEKNEMMCSIITESLTKEEFSGNAAKAVEDGVRVLKLKKLKKQKLELDYRLKQAELVHDAEAVKVLFEESTNINKLLKEL